MTSICSGRTIWRRSRLRRSWRVFSSSRVAERSLFERSRRQGLAQRLVRAHGSCIDLDRVGFGDRRVLHAIPGSGSDRGHRERWRSPTGHAGGWPHPGSGQPGNRLRDRIVLRSISAVWSRDGAVKHAARLLRVGRPKTGQGNVKNMNTAMKTLVGTVFDSASDNNFCY